MNRPEILARMPSDRLAPSLQSGGILPMRTVLGLVLLAVLAAIGLFALQNMQTVVVKFATWTLTAPVAFLVVAVYLIGMVSGWTVMGFLRRSFNRVTAEPRSRAES